MKALEAAIRRTPFFHGLPAPYLKLVTEHSKNSVFKTGSYSCKEGQCADSFLVITSGKVSLGWLRAKNAPGPISSLGPSDILGWSWLVPPYRWHFDAVAIEETKAIEINIKAIRSGFEKDPLLGYEFMRRFFPILESRLNAVYAGPVQKG